MNAEELKKSVELTEEIFTEIHKLTTEWVRKHESPNNDNPRADSMVLAALIIGLESNLNGKLDSMVQSSPVLAMMSTIGVKLISDALAKREEEARRKNMCHCLVCVAEGRVGISKDFNLAGDVGEC